MKLIIQMPCFNEAETLAVAIGALPLEVDGFDEVEFLIIDDGSSDKSVEIAKKCGVHHVISHGSNRGLARAFMTGLAECLRLGADVIVNTDADNQYSAKYIPALTAPVVAGQADIVIGARPISDVEHFSPIKKVLQKLGSWVVRKASRTDIADAPSGFRAISRDAALQLEVFTAYTYTLETIIQAGHNNLIVKSVPVEVNEDLRPSKLVKNIWNYVGRSMGTIVRVFLIYRAVVPLVLLGSAMILAGTGLGVRYLIYFMMGDGSGHIQSIVLAAILIVVGFQTIIFAVLTDMIATNRKLLEKVSYFLKKREYSVDSDANDLKKAVPATSRLRND